MKLHKSFVLSSCLNVDSGGAECAEFGSPFHQRATAEVKISVRCFALWSQDQQVLFVGRVQWNRGIVDLNGGV